MTSNHSPVTWNLAAEVMLRQSEKQAQSKETILRHNLLKNLIAHAVPFDIPSSLSKLLHESTPPMYDDVEEYKNPFPICAFVTKTNLFYEIKDQRIGGTGTLIVEAPCVIISATPDPVSGKNLCSLHVMVQIRAGHDEENKLLAMQNIVFSRLDDAISERNNALEAIKKNLDSVVKLVYHDLLYKDLTDHERKALNNAYSVLETFVAISAFDAIRNILALIEVKEIVLVARHYDDAQRMKRQARGRHGAATTTILVSPRLYDHATTANHYDPDQPKVRPHWVRGHWVHFQSPRYKEARGKKVWIMPYIKGTGDPNKKSYTFDAKAYKELLQ